MICDVIVKIVFSCMVCFQRKVSASLAIKGFFFRNFNPKL